MGVILAVQKWESNAALIADVYRLGYIRGRVFDATPGRQGGWWADLNRVATEDIAIEYNPGFDFRALPIPGETFDAVAFDPPYKLNGTPAMGEMDDRYGVDRVSTLEERRLLMWAGFKECTRVLKPGGYLLAKCMDQVCSGKVRWQTDWYTEWADLLGLVKVDRFDMLGHHIPQPMEGRKQRHAHGRPSTLLVFRK